MEDEVQKRILDKSKELFMRYGARSVSMDDVANQLGVSKKTIYKYYKDKDKLVEQVTLEITAEAQNKCQLHSNEAQNAVDELLKLIAFVNSFMSNMNPTVLYDLEKYYPASYKIFEKYQFDFLYKSIFENLESGIKEGFYRPNLNIDVVAKLRLAQIKIAFNTDLFPKENYELKQVQLASLELYMMGIVSDKGRIEIEKLKKNNEF